jgi:septum formation inhibitor-activating ATPase MinD
MNIVTLITNDIDLYNTFLSYTLFDEVNIASGIDEKTEYGNLIVSDRLYGINRLIEIVDNGLKADRIIYLLSSNMSSQSGYNSLAALLKSHNISVLPPKLTDTQILMKFCDLINLQERKTNNVAVLFGADSKVGTTITALGLAENLAEQSEGNVAVLNLSGHVSFTYVDSNESKGLDSIRSKVFNKILSQDELKEAMVQSRDLKNLYILPPCRTLIDFKYYGTDHIEYVINMASAMFDAVIVDAGWYPHNNLYFGALNSTPNRYLVTTQEDASKNAHFLIRQQALDEYGITVKRNEIDTNVDHPENIMLIVNKYNGEVSTTNFVKGYDMIFAGALPLIPISTYELQSKKKTLRGSSKYYDKQLDKLTNLVALLMEYKLTKKKKTKGFFGIGG